jgi:hypothetical protein
VTGLGYSSLQIPPVRQLFTTSFSRCIVDIYMHWFSLVQDIARQDVAPASLPWRY